MSARRAITGGEWVNPKLGARPSVTNRHWSWHVAGMMSAPEYDYEVIVHPASHLDPPTEPPISIGSFRSTASSATGRISDLVTSQRPHIDLDSRIEVRNDQPDWVNKVRLTADEWIPAERHHEHPKSRLSL